MGITIATPSVISCIACVVGLLLLFLLVSVSLLIPVLFLIAVISNFNAQHVAAR